MYSDYKPCGRIMHASDELSFSPWLSYNCRSTRGIEHGPSIASSYPTFFYSPSLSKYGPGVPFLESRNEELERKNPLPINFRPRRPATPIRVAILVVIVALARIPVSPSTQRANNKHERHHHAIPRIGRGSSAARGREQLGSHSDSKNTSRAPRKPPQCQREQELGGPRPAWVLHHHGAAGQLCRLHLG